jgi:hypothetical protein
MAGLVSHVDGAFNPDAEAEFLGQARTVVLPTVISCPLARK